jgi:DNA-binding transcriptional regulator YhcF (GntR family)
MARSRYKRKGKSKFIMIDGYIMRSAAWKALTANERASYLEVKWRYDGLNNGRIGLGCRELAEAIGVSKDTAKRSLDNLQAKGFIAMMKRSGFNVKNRAATEWRLTEYKCDVTGQLSTKDFMRWTAEEKNTVRPQGHTVRPQGQWQPEKGVNHA